MHINLYQKIFYVEVMYFVTLSVILMTLVVIFLKAKKTPLLYAFMATEGSVCLWIMAKILKNVAPTLTLRWFFVAIELSSVSLLEIFFLELSFIYYKGVPFRKKTRLLLFILPILQIIMVATDPLHHLVYKDFNFVHNTFGILFYIHLGIIYLSLAIGVVLCLIKLSKQFQQEKVKGILFSIAVMIPWLINILYILGILEKFLLSIGIVFVADMTPIFITLSLLIFVYIIFKHDFLDVMPILKSDILQKIEEGYIIYDLDFYVIQSNHYAEKLLGMENTDVCIDQYLREKITSDLSYGVIYKKLCIGNAHSFEVQLKDQIYQFRKKAFRDIGYLLMITNITKYVQLRNEYIEKNNFVSKMNKDLEKRITIAQAAARLNTLNLVARELHDVLGHSITLAINLLEVAKMKYDQKDLAIDKISDAIQIIKNGSNELKNSMAIAAEQEATIIQYDTYQLKYEIESIIEFFNGTYTNIDLFFQGSYTVLDRELFITIKRVIQEAITNSIKHGKAKNIVLSFKFEQDTVEIRIVDNGRGCKKVILGNGLRGMHQRIHKLNGEFRYYYTSGEGFSIYAKI